MLSTILSEIETRLEAVPELHIFSDIKQVAKAQVPAAVIDFNSLSTVDENYKHSKKYKVSLHIQVELFEDSLVNLLTLIEAVEDALKVDQKIDNTLDLDYSGWSKEDTEVGSDIYGARLSFAVNYVRTTA